MSAQSSQFDGWYGLILIYSTIPSVASSTLAVDILVFNPYLEGLIPHCQCVDLSILRLSVWETEVDTENTKVLPSPRTARFLSRVGRVMDEAGLTNTTQSKWCVQRPKLQQQYSMHHWCICRYSPCNLIAWKQARPPVDRFSFDLILLFQHILGFLQHDFCTFDHGRLVKHQ